MHVRAVLMPRLIVGVLLVGSVASCGAATSRGEPSPVPAECPLSADMQWGTTDYASLPLLPDDVEPVGLVQCLVDDETDAAGRWAVVIESRAASGLEDVVAALRLDDVRGPLWNNNACDTSLVALPWTALVLPDGTWLRVGTPVDECSKPLPEVRSALDRVSWEEVSRTRGAQLDTPEQLELAAEAEGLGCGTTYKDMVGTVAGDPPYDPARPMLPPSGKDLLACRYVVDGPGSDGSYVSGARLTSEQSGAVRAAVQDPAPDPGGCTRERTGFVRVHDGGAGSMLVELGACGRAVADSGGLAELPADLVALLDEATR